MELDLSQKKQIKKCAEKYQLKMMILFGSRVKGKIIHQESDFDIAYLSKKDLTGKEIIHFNCDLIDVFHCDRIDLTNLKGVDPLLRQEIARNSQLLFGNEMDYLGFKAFAFKDYINHQPLFDLRELLIKKRHKLLKKSIYGKQKVCAK